MINILSNIIVFIASLIMAFFVYDTGNKIITMQNEINQLQAQMNTLQLNAYHKDAPAGLQKLYEGSHKISLKRITKKGTL